MVNVVTYLYFFVYFGDRYYEIVNKTRMYYELRNISEKNRAKIRFTPLIIITFDSYFYVQFRLSTTNNEREKKGNREKRE